MTIKSDKWIKEKCTKIEHWERGMITPFYPESMSRLHGTEGKKVPSYGLSSYGYDVRLGKHFKIFGNTKPVFSEVDEWIACRKNEAGVMTRTIERAKDFAYKPHPTEIDPCDFDSSIVTEISNVDELVMPPQSFCLGVAMEYIKVPRDVSVVCMGKSTIARAGIIVIVTPLEAEWEGYITLEITNTTRMPVRLTAGMGITQLQFFQSDEQCETSYADRNGKYQRQPYEAVEPKQL